MRWSDPPAADPHRDVTGALHDVSNALTVLLGWVTEARAASASPEQLAHALAIIEDRARAARDLARRAIGAAHEAIDQREESLDAVVGAAEAVPGCLREIRRPFRGNDTVGTGRTRRSQTDGAHRFSGHVREDEHVVESLDERTDRYLRSLPDPARALDQPVHQEATRVVQNRRTVGRAAIVEADDDP